MRTENQIEASRANGARSRGPITPEGKAISSRNAMRHGLLANTILLSNEGGENFKGLFQMNVDKFSPVDDVEMSMIEEMCAAYWRLRRTWAMETSIIESGLASQPPGAPIEQTAGAFCDAAENRHLALLHRYETRLHTMYQRALKNLILIRKATTSTAPAPAEYTEGPEPPAQPETPAPQSQAPPARPEIPNEPEPFPLSYEINVPRPIVSAANPGLERVPPRVGRQPVDTSLRC